MADDQVGVQHIDPDQDRGTVEKIAQDVRSILTPTEDILYVVLQNATALSIKKDSAIATSNRLILYRPGLLGKVNFSDFLWEDVKNVSIKEGMLAGDLTVELTSGRIDRLGGLDKSQLRRFYGIAQQKEQEWREKRRIRELEEARAKAGGVYMGGPTAPSAAAAPAEDPVEKLAKAKAMLDQGLISEAEYEAIKAKVISSF
jgi:hypothetical protein